MPLRTVTYDLHRFAGDTPQIGASLSVKLLKAFATSTQTYDAGEITATIDSDGAGQFDLAVPASGTASYLFTLPSGKSYKVALGAGPATTLEALINAASSVAVPQNTVQAAIDAATGALDARIDTLEQSSGLANYPGHADYVAASIPDTLTAIIDRKAERTEIVVPDLVLLFENKIA